MAIGHVRRVASIRTWCLDVCHNDIYRCMRDAEASTSLVIKSKSCCGMRKIDATVPCLLKRIKVCKQSESANLPRCSSIQPYDRGGALAHIIFLN